MLEPHNFWQSVVMCIVCEIMAWVNTQVPVSIQMPVHLLYMFKYVHAIDFNMKQVIALTGGGWKGLGRGGR